MDTLNEINVDTFPKNEISQEDKVRDKNKGNEKENAKEKREEDVPLSVNQIEAIELYNENLEKKCGTKIKKNLSLIYTILIIICISSIFLYFFFKFRKEYTELINVNKAPIQISEKENQKKASQNLSDSISKTDNIYLINKAETNIISNDVKTNIISKDIKPNIISNDAKTKIESNDVKTNTITSNLKEAQNVLKKSKITIGFLSPNITSFMVSIGECLIKSNKYDVIFITEAPSQKDFKFNENIKRLYAYNNHQLIENAYKSEKIDFLIVNEDLPKSEIEWIKSLGIKVIGVLLDISNQTKEKKSSTNIDLFDAFIQEKPEDYKNFKKNLRNIYIPKIYTFESKSSNLDTMNVIVKTDINDMNEKKNSLDSIIEILPLIVKDIPKIKLYIFISDKLIQKYNELITKLKLNNNILFISSDEINPYFYNTSSLFIYSSIDEICPMQLNKAKAYGLPCIVSSQAKNALSLKTGVVKVDLSNKKILSKTILKILNDNNYRTKLGNEAKLSLEKSNDEALKLWDNLFNSLKSGEKDFQKLRQKIEGYYSKSEKTKKRKIKIF